MTNLVSVIMPCFNSENYIEQSIKSVLNQTHTNFELLICDDSSCDKSYEIIQKYSEQDNRIKLLENNYSKGAPGARNTCLDNVSGDYVSFLDSDDIWKKNKLEKHLTFMNKNKIFFSYSYNDVIDEDGKYITTYKAPKKVNSFKMCFSNFISCSTVIYDRKAVGHIHQPNILKRNDYALWLNILNLEDINHGVCFDEVTSSYRSNTYGLSSNKFDTIKYYYECLIEYNNCSRFLSCLYIMVYITLAFMKKKFTYFYNLIVEII